MLLDARQWAAIVLVATILLVAAAACEDDTDDPFADEGIEIDWPSSNPDRYHWDGLSDPFFEVWNWHVFAPEFDESLTISMGVASPGSDDPETRGAFTHASGGGLAQPVIDLYSMREFDASRQLRDITVGGARGTQTALRGAIGGDEPVEYDLTMTVDAAWDDTFGYLTNIPGLPTNWHVNAIAARATGTLRIGERAFDLDDAPMIEDHFWGTTFPGRSYRVIAGDFDEPDTSLVFFGGEIALGPFDLPIILLAVRHGETVYEFRTQDLDVLGEISSDDAGHYTIRATKGDVRVEVRIINLIEDPAPGLAFGSSGVGFGGWTWHGARVDVNVLRLEEGPGWTTEFDASARHVLFGLGESDLYGDF
ncbi:MAG: hypothetical protein KJ042_13035 [Deltaproteobacteria bacterium]|nr:hypothetical protein [Deltaproteobacteria bacterium]